MTEPRYGAVAEMDQIRAQANTNLDALVGAAKAALGAHGGDRTAAASTLFTHLTGDLAITTQRQGDGVAMLVEAALRLVEGTGSTD